MPTTNVSFLTNLYPPLTEENYVQFAMSHYHNPCCRGLGEFREDLERMKYIKRLISKYLKGKEFRDRLAINHLVVMTNVFGVLPAIHLLVFRVGGELPHLKVLKTLMEHLKLWPSKLDGIEVDVLLLEKLNQG